MFAVVEDVPWLEVLVDDALRMQVAHSLKQIKRDESVKDKDRFWTKQNAEASSLSQNKRSDIDIPRWGGGGWSNAIPQL